MKRDSRRSECRRRAPALLAPRKSKPRKGRTYPLVGFLVCGKCGGPLRSLTRENGGRSYACRKGPGMGGCGGIRIQANGLENHVRDLICGMLADPVTRAAIAELTPAAAPGAMSDSLADLHVRRERLVDLYTEGDIDRATFRTRQARIDEQLQAAEADRSRCSAAMPSIPPTTRRFLWRVGAIKGPNHTRATGTGYSRRRPNYTGIGVVSGARRSRSTGPAAPNLDEGLRSSAGGIASMSTISRFTAPSP